MAHRVERLAQHLTSSPHSTSGLTQAPVAAGAPNGQMLKGVRVVELSTVIAAPSACAQLADLGADVIKVESPDAPDMSRMWGFGDDPTKTADAELHKRLLTRKGVTSGGNGGGGSAYVQINRGKRSILVDFQKPEGVAIVKKLMATADVFVTNVRSKGLKKVGLDYETVKDEFPRLIYAHFTAFGRTGPKVNDPGYDYGAFWANTGIMDLARSSDEASPARVPGGLGDNICATQLAGWIGMALFYQKRTGKGQLVDATLFRAGIGSMTHPMIQHRAGNPWAHSRGSPHIRSSTEVGDRATQVTNVCYKCKDGAIVQFLGENMRQHIKKNLKAFGLTMKEFFGTDTPDYKKVDWRAATERVDEIMASKTYEEWLPIFKANDVWHVRVTRFEDVTEDEQVKASGLYVDVPGLRHPIMRGPVFLSADKGEPQRGAPDAGQHTEEILKEIGVDAEGAAQLRKSKVVA